MHMRKREEKVFFEEKLEVYVRKKQREKGGKTTRRDERRGIEEEIQKSKSSSMGCHKHGKRSDPIDGKATSG